MTIRRAKMNPEVALALAANGIDPDDAAEANSNTNTPSTPASTPSTPASTPNTPASTPASTPSTPAADPAPSNPNSPPPAAPASTPAPGTGGGGANDNGTSTPPSTPNANSGELQAQLSQAQIDLAVERRIVTELRTERDAALAAAVELRTANTNAAALAATHTATISECETALRAACERLCVGVGANASDLESLHGSALVARFNTLTAELQKKYPTAGKPRSNASKPEGGNNTQPEAASPVVAAAVAATRSNNK